MNWYDNYDKVVAIGYVFVEYGILHDPEDVVYYFEKPYKWSLERKQLIERGVIDEEDEE